MKYYIVNPKGLSKAILTFDDLTALFKDLNPGESWEIESIEMTEEEYNKLDEFTGF